jgi:hypothetical protein
MKKPSRKLTLRREILRSLTNLELVPVAGGVIDTGDKACGSNPCVVPDAAVATAATAICR